MASTPFKLSSWPLLSIVQKLIVVNVVVYLLIQILNALLGLFMTSLNNYVNIVEWLAVPASLPRLLIRPWTLFTYMFLHQDFFHILFNMLWLFWMGNLFVEYLGPKKLFSMYVLGGISGAVLYILAFNTFPLFHSVVAKSFALGASAGVLAITVGIATLLPDYSIRLLLFGNVPLKYFAGATLLIDIISISSSNAGGHIAHLGGALFGFVYIIQLRKGRDLANGFNRFIDKITTLASPKTPSFKSSFQKKRAVTDEEYIHSKKSQQEQIDLILEKISKSGYGSLSQQEKDILFRSSREK